VLIVADTIDGVFLSRREPSRLDDVGGAMGWRDPAATSRPGGADQHDLATNPDRTVGPRGVGVLAAKVRPR
jgi:hypothetical protein